MNVRTSARPSSSRAPHGALLAAIVASVVADHAQAQAPRFASLAPAATFPTRSDASYGMVTGDFDGDGDDDVVFANTGQNTFYRNRGDGTFEDVTATHMPVDTASSRHVSAGDVDGDGDLDLVIGNHYATNRLLLNDGSGVFSDGTPAAMAAHQEPTSTAILGDLDGDGDLDIAIGNRGTSNYYSAPYDGQNRVYRNDGTGQFTEATASALPSAQTITESLIACDVDGDGDLDLIELGGEDEVFGPYGSWTVSSDTKVLRNDGTGVFVSAVGAIPTTPAGTAHPFDQDLDGDLDLMVIDCSDQPRFYRNNGAGAFVDVTVGTMPYAGGVACATCVVTPDLDGDGDPDVLIGNRFGVEMALVNQGDGTFWWWSGEITGSLSTAARRMVAVDVDGDGDRDLVMASSDGPNLLLHWNGVDRFVDPDAVGGAQWFARAQSYPESGAMVDLDGDGRRDLVQIDVAQGVSVLAHTGNGFERRTGWEPQITQVSYPARMAAGDLDGDGDPDVLAATFGALVVCRNDGTGRLVASSSAYAGSVQSIAIGDVDGDGNADVVVGVAAGAAVSVLRGDGAGGLAAGVGIPNSSYGGRDLALFDLDGDGDLDIVSCQSLGAFLYENDGSGNFTVLASPLTQLLSSPQSVDVADVDGDGDLDLVFVDGNSWSTQTQKLFLNTGTGVFGNAPNGNLPPHGLPAGRHLNHIRFVDFDGDGDADVASLYAVTSSGLQLGGARLFENQGNGSFQDVSTDVAEWSTTPRELFVDDVDLDGDPDLLALGNPGPSVYFNLRRHVHIAARLPPGGTLELEAYARGVQVAPTAIVIPWVSQVAVSVPLPPFGHLGIDPLAAISLPPIAIDPATGDGTSSLPLPNLPGLVGQPLLVQGLLLNPPGELELTNTSTRVFVP
jgi:hypothetical protein